MITAKFMLDRGKIIGFDVSGHSGYAQAGGDIVCAAVSSAVALCERALSDILGVGLSAEIDEEAARVCVKLRGEPVQDSQKACDCILSALMLHLVSLKEEYPQYIEVLEV